MKDGKRGKRENIGKKGEKRGKKGEKGGKRGIKRKTEGKRANHFQISLIGFYQLIAHNSINFDDIGL